MDREESYNNLPTNVKKLIQMYLTARQFKNAISIDEMFIIPAFQNNLPENSTLKLEDLGKFATFRGNRMVTKVFPFIVDKAFACEVYLKFLLSIDNKKIQKIHTLDEFFSKLDNIKQDKIIEIMYGKCEEAQRVAFNLNLSQVSNAFETWRYIYEHFEEKNIINHGFLNAFCDALDVVSSTLIKEKFNYDVSKNIM